MRGVAGRQHEGCGPRHPGGSGARASAPEPQRLSLCRVFLSEGHGSGARAATAAPGGQDANSKQQKTHGWLQAAAWVERACSFRLPVSPAKRVATFKSADGAARVQTNPSQLRQEHEATLSSSAIESASIPAAAVLVLVPACIDPPAGHKGDASPPCVIVDCNSGTFRDSLATADIDVVVPGPDSRTTVQSWLRLGASKVALLKGLLLQSLRPVFVFRLRDFGPTTLLEVLWKQHRNLSRRV